MPKPISTSNDKYNLRVMLKSDMSHNVPDAWIEGWATETYREQGLEWVVKWVKDYCENTAESPKYRSDTKGLRLRIRNWLKNKAEWAGPDTSVKFVGNKYERKNG